MRAEDLIVGGTYEVFCLSQMSLPFWVSIRVGEHYVLSRIIDTGTTDRTWYFDPVSSGPGRKFSLGHVSSFEYLRPVMSPSAPVEAALTVEGTRSGTCPVCVGEVSPLHQGCTCPGYIPAEVRLMQRLM